MDNIDKKILHLLQHNARTPLKYLANKVFLSSPAVSARIDRLEKASPDTMQASTRKLWGITLPHLYTWHSIQNRNQPFIPLSMPAPMYWNVIV